ncbi:MAG: hypothetical protein K0S41_332 [Anaerocolumna sp.]|nr:hypothetical protein [Anaerocolumna sp.]
MANRKRIVLGIVTGILTITLLTSISVMVLANKSDRLITFESADTNNPVIDPQAAIRNSEGNVTFENDEYIMYLDETTLGVEIKDKKTGFIYESTKQDESSNESWKGFLNSGVSVEFYSQRSTMPERVDLLKGNPEKTFLFYKDGFDVTLNYKNYEFSMCLEVRLQESGMTANVKKDSMKEGETYKLGSIYLYPMFGATSKDSEAGYMFVPEGAGALIDLKDNHGKFKTPYIKKIYGANVGIDKFQVSESYRPAVTEPEKITVPVFGMVYTKKAQGFLGIVTDGQYNAEILAYPNGVTTEYNWLSAKFNFREIYTMQTAESSGVPTFEKTPYIRDIGIRYQFVSGDAANYTGLAKTYQDYLIGKGDLQKQEDKFEVKLDFFGADSKKWFIFDVVVPMTTVGQMDSIITDLTKDDVKDILPVYTGWQTKGVSLNYGSGNFKVERKLGSQRELFALIEKLNKQDIDLVLNQDLLWANPKRFYNTSSDIVKGINQIIVEEPTNAWVFDSMYYLTPSRSFEFAKRFMKRYEDTVVKNVALSKVSNTLFSYYSGGDIYSRGDTASKMLETLETFDTVNLSLEQPADYTWEYANKYFDMPLSTSNYSYLSEEVPFIPMVLKGYIPYWASYSNFEANEKQFFLKMIEYGAYPSFILTEESPNLLRNTNSSYIYTSEYDVLKGTIIKYYTEIGDVLRLVEGVSIQSHNYVDNNVVSVVYENGVQIIINYSNEDYELGDTIIPTMSFIVNEIQ